MPAAFTKSAALAAAALALAACDNTNANAPAQSAVKHGEYLVTVMACGDCHTPGYFLGKPDETRKLAGGDVGFFIPGLGYFYGRNLTSDAQTGLGTWSDKQIVTALRTGVRPDGRILSPNMPWRSFANLSDADAFAIAAYLKSLKPIKNDPPPPTGANETAPAPYLAVTMPQATAEAPTK